MQAVHYIELSTLFYLIPRNSLPTGTGKLPQARDWNFIRLGVGFMVMGYVMYVIGFKLNKMGYD